jgi:predicted metal-dependent phosphoesterase TrpH
VIFDLHSHTGFSDGSLLPAALIQRALENRVDVLSITDHDTVDAYRHLPQDLAGIELVCGIEFSTQWNNTGIHVLGLNIDPESDAIEAGVRFQTDARMQRARRIGEKLEKRGIKDAFAGAAKLANGSYIGRPHFARHVINVGKAKDMNAAFKNYLGDGKAGDVREHWAELAQIIEWIRDANGVAVLAHPLKYKLTRTRLKKLLADFIGLGGQGMEVVSGQQTPQHTSGMVQVCVELDLLASCGSDFHTPGQRWADLGSFMPLPPRVTPVWERF